MDFSIAFIGGGNMARSIIAGLLHQGFNKQQIRVSEPYAPVRENLAKELGLKVDHDNRMVAASSQVWLFAVKPQVMKTVCAELKDLAQAQQPLVISIAAGITASQLDLWLGGNMKVVRAMPNTPALLGAGASGLFASANVNAEQKLIVEQLFQTTGLSIWVANETLIDSVTALSGSGPAYVFLLAEAMQAAAMQQGLSQEIAQALTVQTFVGAAKMLSETSESAAELRKRVTSPNGTTQAAIETFEQNGLREIVQSAMHAASERGKTLSQEND